MSTIAVAALGYARRGLRVFPCKERGKEPMFKGWPELATTDPQRISNWWSSGAFNIGVVTGPASGIWVLDVDGEDGESTLRALEIEYDALPPTVEAITGKGRHLYFRWPQGIEIGNSQCRPDLPGIDWRGNGGYVLAPPSIHPSGRRYCWSVDSADEFADAPEWLIDLVTKRPRGRNSEPMAATPESWRSFVNNSADGSHCDHAIARLYGLLVRRYIDPIVALDLVRMFNAARCTPPLDDDEVVRIVDAIAEREANRRGM
jgi:hypothetical protein